MPWFKQNETTATYRRVPFIAVDKNDPTVRLSDTDMDIGGTGSFIVNISKNASIPPESPNAHSVIYMGDAYVKGLFYLELDQDDLSDLGFLFIHIMSDGGPKVMEPREIIWEVRPYGIYEVPPVTVGTNGISSSSIAANAITSSKIAANAITASHIDSNAITSSKIAAGAISSAQLADGAITANKLASNAITSDKIAASAIGASQLASGAITSAKFAAGAISASALASGAIQLATLANDVIPAISDGVWDEDLSGHSSSGSAGKALNDSGSSVNPTAIASAVWDESRVSHSSPGSFGEGVRISSIGTDAITGTAVASSAVAKIQSGLALASDLSTAQSTIDTVNTKIGTPSGVSVSADVQALDTKLGSPTGASVSADIASIKSDTGSTLGQVSGIATDVGSLKKVNLGRWKIQGTQLILYEDDGVTPFKTFNLLDDTGTPSNARIFERVPV